MDLHTYYTYGYDAIILITGQPIDWSINFHVKYNVIIWCDVIIVIEQSRTMIFL